MSNRSIRRFIGLLAGLLSIKYIYNSRSRSKSADKRKTDRAFEHPDVQRTLNRLSVVYDPIEKDHREKEEIYWEKTSNYAFWAVVVSGLALSFAAGAFIETRRQANAADEGNRPWLDIVQIDIHQFGTGGGEIGGVFDVYLVDYGHSPGQNVIIRGSISTRLDEDTGESVCKDNLSKPTFGIVVFPTRPNVFPAGIGKNLADFIQKYKTERPTYWPEWKDFQKAADLVVSGCIIYTGAGDKVYHTAFRYIFGAVDLTKSTMIENPASVKVLRDFYGTPYVD